MSKKKTTGKPERAGFTDAQILAAVKARDSAKPNTPVAVVQAFFPDAIRVGVNTLNEVTMSVILALQKSRSSLLRKDVEFALEDVAAALLILTIPITQVRALLAVRNTSGEPLFPLFDDAVNAVADKIPAAEIKPLGAAINKHLADAFENLIPHGVGKGTPADSPFPTAPTPGPEPAGS